MSSALGLQRGTVIGQYRIIRRIGKGGMGVVYEAFEEALNRRVAIKMIHEEHMQDEETIKRFEVEGRALARINNPHVVTVFNLGRYQGVPYLVMEYVDGVTLRDYLRKKVFTVKEALPLFKQLLTGVHGLHRSGIVHRDLKPHNIIYQPNHEVKIVDFGVAKMLMATGHEITGAGTIIGSAKYISPEGAVGQPVTIQSDIWSLGVLFYEMLVGETPFEAATYQEVIEKVKSGPIQFPLFAKLFTGKEIQSLVLKMLQRPLDLRYLNAEQVLNRLDTIIDRYGKDTLGKPDLAGELRAHLPVKNEAKLFSRIERMGYDAYRAKLIITLALNEQAKIDSRMKTIREDTVTEVGTETEEIEISDRALSEAIRIMEASQPKTERKPHEERRSRPRSNTNNKKKSSWDPVIVIPVALSIMMALVHFLMPESSGPKNQTELSSQQNSEAEAQLQRERQLREAAEERARLAEERARAEAQAKAEALWQAEERAIAERAAAEEAAKEAMAKAEAEARARAAADAKAKAEAAARARAAEARAAVEAKARARAAARARAKAKAEAEARARARTKAEAKVRAAVKKQATEKTVNLVTPKILSPVNGTSVTNSGRSPASVLFLWEKQEPADGFEIEFSLKSDFKEIFLRKSLRENQYNLDRPLPYGTVYWRVRARTTRKASNWSAAQSLVVTPPS